MLSATYGRRSFRSRCAGSTGIRFHARRVSLARKHVRGLSGFRQNLSASIRTNKKSLISQPGVSEWSPSFYP